MLQQRVCLHAARAAVSDGRRRHGGYAYIGVAQIKVYKQRWTPKVALQPPRCWIWAAHRRGAEEALAADFTEPGAEVWQRGAGKHSPPNVPPSRHRRNNMSAKDGHVLLVMSTRGGGKVDTAFFARSAVSTAAFRTESRTRGGGTKHPNNNLAEAFGEHAGVVDDRGRQSSRGQTS